MVNYLQYTQFDTANGYGVRSSIFWAGCSLHCKGCWNPESWNPRNGKPYTQETENLIISGLAHPAIEGLSMLGGEPFENLEGSIPLATAVRKTYGDTKTIWSWSGYTIEEILNNPERIELLQKIDVLVDGRFILSKRDTSLEFRGSQNQRIINVPQTLTTGQIVLWKSPYSLHNAIS